MPLRSRGIALLLAFAIAGLSVAFLSLVEGVTGFQLFVGAVIPFSVSYLLIYITFEFLIFREINKLYNVFEKLQKKDLTFLDKKPSKGSFHPLKRINDEIYIYATDRQREIDELQKLAAFRREFIADISHELKTPIFSAQGYVHTLLDGAIDDKAVRMKFLKRAAKSLNALDKLVHDLLTLSQMENGSIRFHYEDFDLLEIIPEVFEQLEHKAERREISLQLIKKSDKPYMVHADKDKIFRVIQNLISNSIKYNKDGGIVELQLDRNKSDITISVRDNGKGIPADDIKRIFERFYRVDKSRSKEKGGTGLGLAIVKHILEAHQTKITVTSSVGKGSVFSFKLQKAVNPVATIEEPTEKINSMD
ncbi:sensor histidine kinase [Penaeicola halotolerans]|uniref:sensor histidine kinase n=1 Tax=Penaeicola halotolerans TaxID=2793196 RepID=UPI001CF859F3|nr:ATP-binding protein [Penaeicola halotolerans]